MALLDTIPAAACPRPESGWRDDAHLLESFLRERSEEAFEALVARHGPLVLSVCGRILSDPHEREDAFQATFLVLARQAATLRKRASLASWLYGIAVRVAHRAQRSATDLRNQERHVVRKSAAVSPGENKWAEMRPLLDAELERLPEKYRAPIVLCYLQGLTHTEASRQLGWTKGTLSGRLARARELLRARLTRRGVALALAPLGSLLAERAAGEALVPADLVAKTVQVAQAGSGLRPGSSAILSPRILHLSKGITLMTYARDWRLLTLAAGAFLLAAGLVLEGTPGAAGEGDTAPAPLPQAQTAAGPVAPLPALGEAELTALFERVAGETGKDREGTEARLMAGGEATRAFLKKRQADSDPEVSKRATFWLGKLETYPLVSKITAALGLVGTLSGEMALDLDMLGMRMSGKGSFQTQRQPARTRMAMQMDFMSQKMDSLTVFDGQCSWSEITINQGGRMVMKSADPELMRLNQKTQGSGNDPMGMFDSFFRDYDFYGQEEVVEDGKPGLLLRGSLKPGVAEAQSELLKAKFGEAMAGQAKMQQLIQNSLILVLDKAAAAVVRVSFLDAQGKPAATTRFSNLRFNQPLEERLFTYQPPAGAQIWDLDTMLKAMTAQGLPAGQPGVPPPSEPKAETGKSAEKF